MKNIPGPPALPKCRHDKIVNRYESCRECLAEDKEIKKLTNLLIDEYWKGKGKDDLYHIVYRAYRMGMRKEHESKT